MAESLFSRVTRYPQSPSVNPRENRLTEVTAAVLEGVDGLAKAVVEALLGGDGVGGPLVSPESTPEASALAQQRVDALTATRSLVNPRVTITTQLTTPKGRFVDLEIWLRPERPADQLDDVRVWIEAKHGSSVHGNQLKLYVAEIVGYPARHRMVLLLAPRGQDFPAPKSVLLVEWQTIAKVVAAWLQAERCSPEELWLLGEYAAYLEEEGLMDPEALDVATALALMESNDAEAIIEVICEHADALVARDWAPCLEARMTGRANPRPDFGLGYWGKYPLVTTAPAPSKTWRGGWLEWGMRNTEEIEGLNDPRGSFVFYAGASFEPKLNPIKAEGNEEWANARLADGFLRSAFYWHRLVRLKYPDELLAQTTLEAQGQALGEWVVEAFERLAQNAPPQ